MIREDLSAALVPWMTPDLQVYLEAVSSMFDEVELYSADTDVFEGWSILLDPDRCPVEVLPYLAQYVGERLPAGLDEAGSREWIKDAPNQRRGTLISLVYAAQRSLTGQRTVALFERSGASGGDDPDRLVVNTYTSETPDQAVVLRDLVGVVPADIVLVYVLLAGQTWASVNTTYATWAAVQAANATWENVRSVRTGYDTYTRPRPST